MIIVIAILMIFGFIVVDDQGVSLDEKPYSNSVLFNYKLIFEGEPIPIGLRHYGTVFHFLAEALYQVKSIVTSGTTSTRYFSSDADTDLMARMEYRERIELKHGMSFLLFLITCLAVAGIVGILAGLEYAWLGPIGLVLMPRFFGHSSFNANDIPFAAMLTLGTFIGAKMVAIYLKIDPDDVKAGWNRIAAYSILYGVLVGLVSGTRIAGCLLIAFVPIAHLAVNIGRRRPFREFLSSWAFYGLMFISWLVTVIIIHPASWANPFGWFVEAVALMSQYEWEGANLYMGQFVLAKYVPWHYLPAWLVITTPLLVQLLFIVGGVMMLFRYRKLTASQQACAIMVVLQIGFMPAFAIARNSTNYEALRHFLFILPGIAAIAATGVAWIMQSMRRRAYKFATIVLLVVLTVPIAADMIALHPYQYVYFNRAFGGLKEAQNQFDTDYYGLSGREAMEWVNENAKPGELVTTGGGNPLTETYAIPTIDVIHTDELEKVRSDEPFYFIIRPRYNFQERFPECPVVYEVTRQEVPLTIVKRCD